MIFKRVLKNLFHDQDGRVVIAQAPNISGGLTIIFILLKWRPLAAITGLYWSYLEIRYGVNDFRKVLGAVVAIMIVSEVFRSVV